MRIWTRLGVAIVILGVFGFFALKALKTSNFLLARQKQIAITLAGAGALLWLVQKVHHKPVEVEGEDAEKYITPFYATGSYWGVILLLCGGMVGYSKELKQAVDSAQWKERLGSLEKLVRLPKIGSAHSRTAKANSAPLPKLQGIGFNPNPAKSSVIINGQTLLCGEKTETVKVLSINAGSVTVEVADGQVKVLTLR
jgi:hypothetical protein